jgi:hypothetical protein
MISVKLLADEWFVQTNARVSTDHRDQHWRAKLFLVMMPRSICLWSWTETLFAVYILTSDHLFVVSSAAPCAGASPQWICTRSLVATIPATAWTCNAAQCFLFSRRLHKWRSWEPSSSQSQSKFTIEQRSKPWKHPLQPPKPIWEQWATRYARWEETRRYILLTCHCPIFNTYESFSIVQ